MLLCTINPRALTFVSVNFGRILIHCVSVVGVGGVTESDGFGLFIGWGWAGCTC